MTKKKKPAITHSVRIPVSESTCIQEQADRETAGNFSEMLLKIITAYYEPLLSSIPRSKKKTVKKKRLAKK
jgi:hypothetical protein